MATIKDVAKLAGVSTATVSNTITRSRYVSDDLRKRVEAAMRELSYTPNGIASSLKKKRTDMIALVIGDINNSYFTTMSRGVEDEVNRHGFSLILCNTDENPEKEQMYLRAISTRRVDGIIIASTGSPICREEILRFMRNHALVLVDREVEGLDADVVLSENFQGAYDAVKHLIDLGHTKIGLVSFPERITSGKERKRGFEQALADHGLVPNRNYIRICDGYKSEMAYEGTLDLLRQPDPPTALFATSNLMTVGAIRAIVDSGLTVPRDISFVGFDDLDWTTLFSPRLTVVAQATYDIGVLAAQRVIKRINGDPSLQTERFAVQTRLLIRESVGPPNIRT